MKAPMRRFENSWARRGGPPLGLRGNGALFNQSKRSTTTRSRLWQAALVAAIALPAANGTVRASGVPFTWDPSEASPPLSGAGSAFTADTIDAANYLHSIIQTSGSFVEQLVLNIGGFQLNGQPVTAPGLDTTYGLYFAIDATGQQIAGKTTFNTLNISLMADPDNNDARSAPVSPAFPSPIPARPVSRMTLPWAQARSFPHQWHSIQSRWCGPPTMWKILRQSPMKPGFSATSRRCWRCS